MDKDTLINYMGWLNAVSGICTFLVAFGVAGEFLVHILHSRWEKQLDAIQEREKEELRESAAAANERAAQTELKAEQYRKENLELEENVSPRRFYSQQDVLAALPAFPGTKAMIEYLPDYECRDAAWYIASVLGQAKWNILFCKPNSKECEYFDGVTVEANVLPPCPPELEPASDAAYLLVSELNKANIRSGIFGPGNGLEKGVVRIRVGQRPSPKDKEKWKWRVEVHELTYKLKKTRDPQEMQELTRKLHELMGKGFESSFPPGIGKGQDGNKPPDAPPAKASDGK
jgi:hypothetical protein